MGTNTRVFILEDEEKGEEEEKAGQCVDRMAMVWAADAATTLSLRLEPNRTLRGGFSTTCLFFFFPLDILRALRPTSVGAHKQSLIGALASLRRR